VSVAEALRFQRLEARVAMLEGLLGELTAVWAAMTAFSRRVRCLRASMPKKTPTPDAG
jgi:hypothetical protein